MQDLLSLVKENDEMIQEMYRLTIIGIIKAKVIYRIEKYIIYIDILVWGGYIEYRDERRQRDEEKKTNDIYANCLDQFGVLDITIRRRQQMIYIPCDSSGANKQL